MLKTIYVATCFLAYLSVVTADIFDDIENATNEIESGNINEAHDQLMALYSDNPGMALVQNAYLNLLYQTGQYNRVIGNIEANKKIERDGSGEIKNSGIKDLLKKSKNAINLMKSLYLNIDQLYEESPYSKPVLQTRCDKLLRLKKFKEADECIEQASLYFPKDPKIEKTRFHLMVCKGEFGAGIRGLKKIDNKEIVTKLQNCHQKYKMIKNDYTKALANEKARGGNYSSVFESIIRNLNTLLKEINPLMLADTYQPSIFYHLKYLILNDLVVLGIKLKKKGQSQIAKQVLKYRDTDTEKYNYIQCLLIDEDVDMITKELDQMIFTNKNVRNNLDLSFLVLQNRIKREKEEIERRKREEKEQAERQREQQKRQQQQREQHRRQQQPKEGPKKGQDYKGYYKAMGIDSKASKADIKKKYRKLVKEQNPDKYKGKDEKKYKEMSDKMMQINEAKTVLLDDDKRAQYDAGVYGLEPQGAHQFNNGDFGDIFSAFFGGGGGGVFFENSSGRSHGGGGQRYYYSSNRGYF